MCSYGCVASDHVIGIACAEGQILCTTQAHTLSTVPLDIRKNTQNELLCQTTNSDEHAVGMKRWLEVHLACQQIYSVHFWIILLLFIFGSDFVYLEPDPQHCWSGGGGSPRSIDCMESRWYSHGVSWP